MRRWSLVLALVGVALVAGAQSELEDRVRELLRLGRYELAADMIEDREDRGERLTPGTEWVRAQLETDPDRFDRMALAVASTAPDLTYEVTLGRAREQFARGRYQTAADLLRPWTELTEGTVPSEALLWVGMAEQAAGQAGAAVRAFERIARSAPEYGTARALLADLAVRGGRLDQAEEHARAALDADPGVGSMALSVLERAARERGDEEAAQQWRNRLAAEYPRSAEAAWTRAPVSDVGDDAAPTTDHEFEDGRDAFALQFGAFRDRALALRLADRVMDAIDEVRIEIERDDDAIFYRVVGGRYLTRAQAESARERLVDDGWDTLVVAPTRGGR